MTFTPSTPDPIPGAETIGRILVALFRSRAEAEEAIRDLKDAGFPNENIGVATHDRIDAPQPEPAPESAAPSMEAAAGAGAVSGGVVGGLLGLIGSLLIPGVGPVVLGGVLASALMGAGIGAATGGLVGALTTMGVPESEAQYFDEGLRAGGTLVTVRGNARIDEAFAILQRRGADLGPLSVSHARLERRSGPDPAYAGPERRLARL